MHLSQVSEVLGIPLKQLQDLNPQYLHNIIPAGEKQYSLCIPTDYIMSFINNEDSIFTYKDSVYLDPAKYTVSPASHSHTSYTPEAPGADYTKLIYTVKSGDNLGFISEWYSVSISDLKYWNNIRRNMIRSGQKLAIYKKKGVADKYKDINNMSFAEKQARIGKTVAAPVTVQNQTAPQSGEYIMYTVKSGDTLWDIAKKYPGVSDSDIMRLNNLSSSSKIHPGQQLKIKPKT